MTSLSSDGSFEGFCDISDDLDDFVARNRAKAESAPSMQSEKKKITTLDSSARRVPPPRLSLLKISPAPGEYVCVCGGERERE